MTATIPAPAPADTEAPDTATTPAPAADADGVRTTAGSFCLMCGASGADPCLGSCPNNIPAYWD